MKKFNKALMMTVATLLTLVLISSCIVSGTMAKYVVSKNSTATATLKTFGTTLTVTAGSGLTKKEVAAEKKGESIVYNLTAGDLEVVKMNPGDSYINAARFTFGKTAPATAVKVTIKFDLDYDPNDFKIPAGTSVGGISSNNDIFVMPLGFTFGFQPTTATGNYLLEPFYICEATTAEAAKAEVEHKLADTMDKDITTPSSNNCVDNYFTLSYTSTSTRLRVKYHGSNSYRYEFDLGFVWPETYTNTTTNYNYDVIGSYLVENAPDDAKIGVVYTVTVEQNN